MIKQSAIGLNSRSEVNPFNEDGFLPLITAPMYGVVDESNYQVFLDNKIQVCIPRNISLGDKYPSTTKGFFISMSLEEFKSHVEYPTDLIEQFAVCIDTANGNMPALHKAIREAKEIHGDKLIIMAGNVASVEAFVELAKTGVDYIRVGIGGGGGCNTTSNVGVGQEDLGELIKYCKFTIIDALKERDSFAPSKDGSFKHPDWETYYYNRQNISKVKIVADGISSYINLCQQKYGYNDNGYAAINKLLDCGADLVMVGKLFAQCVESAGEKGFQNLNGIQTFEEWNTEREKSGLFGMPSYNSFEEVFKSRKDKRGILVKYSGMSTQEEQKKYQPKFDPEYNSDVDDMFMELRDWKKGERVFDIKFTHTETYMDGTWYWGVRKNGKPTGYKLENILFEKQIDQNIKPSEGSVQWIPVRFLLSDWIKGNSEQDTYPYLMGFENALRSAMSYTGSKTLEEFKNGK